MTTTTLNYISEAELYAHIGSPAYPGGNDKATSAILAASREIDAHCGRYFYQADETQYFSADPRQRNSLWILPLDDMELATTTGLVVTSEMGNDGTYPVSWTLNTDFICEPINQSSGGITGWPYTSLRAIGGKVWPFRFVAWQRDTVKIVATYGWPAVPEAVKLATKLLAARNFKIGDAPLGAAGFGEFGVVRVKDVPQVVQILAPYVKTGVRYGVA